MTSTITHTIIPISCRFLLDVGVIVRVIVRGHNNYPKRYCEYRAGFINRDR